MVDSHAEVYCYNSTISPVSIEPACKQLHVTAYDLPGVPLGRVRELQRQDPELSDLITFMETDELPTNNNRARSFMLYGDKSST